MTRNDFVKAVAQNATTVRAYKNGYDGRDKSGFCDCIGLIIGAFEILGQSWPGTHGTNWTARYFVDGLTEFNSVLDLKKGDVVLKAKDPGQDGYRLPDTYKNDPDQHDYYHIGVVMSETPFQIVHCTDVPGGIQYDQGKRNWRYKGVLKPIKDEGGKTKVIKAYVTADNEYPVKLRAKPSQTATVLIKVKKGEEIDILEEGPEWSKVRYQEITGYMMTKFTVPVASDDPMPPEVDPPDETEPAPVPPEGDEYVTIKVPFSLAWQLLEILYGTLGKG